MTFGTAPVATDHLEAPSTVGTSIVLLGGMTLGALVGLISPASAATLSGSLEATLLLMIFLLFFELRLRSLFEVVRAVRFFALAWSANFLIVPVIGFVIASLFFFGQPWLFAGLMIYFLAPCTDWFLGFTRLAQGDTKLGATLIPINLMSQLLLFPLWLWLLASEAQSPDVLTSLNMMVHWFVVPMLAAQSIRFGIERVLSSAQSQAILPLVGRLVPIVLAAVVFQIFAINIGEISAHFSLVASVAAAVILFFIAAFTVGEGLARLGRLGYPQRALLSITMAARNGPLMLALTAIAIPHQPLLVVVIVAGMLIEMPLLTVLNQILLRLRSER